jgi:hypothetical protein
LYELAWILMLTGTIIHGFEEDYDATFVSTRTANQTNHSLPLIRLDCFSVDEDSTNQSK